jgi:hypothetical protein
MTNAFPVYTEPMEPVRRKMLEERTQLLIEHDPRIAELQERLLKFGGEAGAWVPDSPWMDALLARGTLFSGESRSGKGQISNCHFNAARLWAGARTHRQLVTGYALSEDGCWRRHTWVLDPVKGKPPLVETTIPRLLYFGVILTPEEAEYFWQAEGSPEFAKRKKPQG